MKKLFKTLVVLLIALALVFSVCGCASDSDKVEETAKESVQDSTDGKDSTGGEDNDNEDDIKEDNGLSNTSIVAVFADAEHTVGLRSDGTVVATGCNDDGQCDVSGWTDIVAVDTNADHTVGLRSDGTVVAVGYNGDGRCNVSDWTDIVAVSASSSHTVGLKSDGTVVATEVILAHPDFYA